MSALPRIALPEGSGDEYFTTDAKRAPLKVADESSSPVGSPARELSQALSRALSEDRPFVDQIRNPRAQDLEAPEGWSRRRSLAFIGLSSLALWASLFLAVRALFL